MTEQNYSFDMSVQNADINSTLQTLSVTLTFAKIIKGDPFTYDDFTPEQIAELKQPATEAKAEVDEALAGLSSLEQTVEDNEESRNARVDEALTDLAEMKQQVNLAISDAESATASANTATLNAESATNDANDAADNANAMADKANIASNTPYINEDTMTWWKYNPTTKRYEDSHLLANSSPYATFEINPQTMQLEMTTSAYYGGPTISMESNELVLTI